MPTAGNDGKDGPRERPIVERPKCLDNQGDYWYGHMKRDVVRYVEHLEARIIQEAGRNAALINEILQAKAIIEGLTHERDMAEKALSDAHTRLEAIYEEHGPDVEGVEPDAEEQEQRGPVGWNAHH